MMRLLYAEIEAGNVEFAAVTVQSIVPAPGGLVVVHKVLFSNVPPLVMSIALPATLELTALTFSVSVQPMSHCKAPAVENPTVRLP